MGLFLGSLFCSIDLCICFCANTIVFWLLQLCSIIWSQGGWHLQLCPPFFFQDCFDYWSSTPVLLPGKSHGWRSLVGCSPWVVKSQTRLSNFTFTFHFHALEKEMATHSSVLACRIPGTGEPGGLPSIGSHRVGHDWSDLAAVRGFIQTLGFFVPILWKITWVF